MSSEHIWHSSNVTIIEYDSENYLNTWIPVRWIVHDNYLHEQARIIDVQLMLNYGRPIIAHNRNLRLFSSLQFNFCRHFHK